MKNEKEPCYICGALFAIGNGANPKDSIKKHIINKARVEAFHSLLGMIDASGRKPYEFSPIVLLSTIPHFAAVQRNAVYRRSFGVDI